MGMKNRPLGGRAYLGGHLRSQGSIYLMSNPFSTPDCRTDPCQCPVIWFEVESGESNHQIQRLSARHGRRYGMHSGPGGVEPEPPKESARSIALANGYSNKAFMPALFPLVGFQDLTLRDLEK